MRIIDTRGKDYYDGVMFSLFHGDDLLFVREEEIVYVNRKDVRWGSWGTWDWDNLIKDWPFGNDIASRRISFD
mgnify:CR=1 FL=1